MNKLILFCLLQAFILSNINAQIKVSTDGRFHLGYPVGSYCPIYIGQDPSGATGGQWAIEWSLGDNGLNFWKPWGSNNWGNYKLFIAENGNIGLGKIPSASYKLDVSGNVTANGYYVTSDEKLKQNIKPLADNNCMNRLYKMNGKSYNLVKRTYKINPNSYMVNGKIDSLKYKTIMYDNGVVDNSLKNTRYGFLAQELQTVFPDLVATDEDGYLAVDYFGLIPIIVEALKEQQVAMQQQQATIQQLQNQINQCCNNPKLKSAAINGTDTLSSLTAIGTTSVLFQNAPNPFTQSTSINYFLASTVAQAQICVFNMQGTMLKTYPLSGTGTGSLTINGSEFVAGMYMYSLLADGKLIDTKQMVLTK